MKKLYFFLLLSISCSVFAQTPNIIYYPNSNNTPTVLTGNIEYLCGPNTVVIDTIVNSCKIYVSSNCTLTLKPHCPFCASFMNVYLQANSVLNILPGSCVQLNVAYEPGAIINNPTNATYFSNSVTTISWPIVNCIATGIKSNNYDNENVILYPNPAVDVLNINLEVATEIEFNNLKIFNNIGQIIREEEIEIKSNTTLISTSKLPNGIYFLSLKSVNMPAVSKRFIVAH